MNLIILAAGKSSRIYKKIKKNKCLINVNRKQTIIGKIIDDAAPYFNKIYVITGFNKKYLQNIIHKKNKNIKFIYNKEYYKKDMLHSLYLGLKHSNDSTLICYSDIIFDKKIFKKISNVFNKINHISLPLLKNWRRIWKERNKLETLDAEEIKINKSNFVKKIGKKINFKDKNTKYQFMGILYFPKNKTKKILKIYQKIKDKKLQSTNFIQYLIDNNYKIKAIPLSAFWYEIDDYEDYVFFKNNYKHI